MATVSHPTIGVQSPHCFVHTLALVLMLELSCVRARAILETGFTNAERKTLLGIKYASIHCRRRCNLDEVLERLSYASITPNPT